MLAAGCRAALCLGLVLGLATSLGAEPDPRAVGPLSAEVRHTFRLDPFYVQHVDVEGLPVVGSARVDPHALLEAAYVIDAMLARRRDLLAALAASRVRCCVMAHTELTTDVPEHADLRPKRYWNRRARGLGASPQRPCVSCGEEKLLGYPGDPYVGESILVHEFAHAVHLMALRRLDPTFERRLERCYRRAMDAGRWKGLYASENKEEYWAEGVQSWFDTNRPPDDLHNHVDTRAELAAYDPPLAALVAEVFRDNPWRYHAPAARGDPAHLRGFDRSQAPRFAWPRGLSAWYRAYLERRKTGAGWEALEPRPLAEARTLRSRATSRPTTILFLNRTRRNLRLFWLDFDGVRRPYGRLGAGRSNELPTFAGHAWVLSDEAGTDLAVFVAGARPGRAAVGR